MLTADEIDVRRQAARKREIIERILPGVERMLDETDGYVNISVDDILRSSGLARSTFYRYFKDKNDLLIALSEPALEVVMAAAMHPWEFGADATPERLEVALLETMQAYTPHQALLDAIVEASAYYPAVRQRFRSGFDQVQDALTARLEEGQAQGFVRSDLLARETAGWLTWMAERGMSQLVPSTDAAERQRLAKGIAAIMWHTVYADGA